MSKPEKQKEKLTVKVEAVAELPKGRKLSRVTEYDDAIKQVLSSEGTVFKIAIGEKTMRQMYSPLDVRIKRINADPNQKYNLTLKTRSKQIFIVKEKKA